MLELKDYKGVGDGLVELEIAVEVDDEFLLGCRPPGC